MKHYRIIMSLLLLIPLLISAQVDRTDYFVPGEQEKELMIIVHVWGEVNNPGRFIVRDGTNLLDIISEAGGPTRYASLKKVYVAHKRDENPHIEMINIRTYTERENIPIPVLLPGDVVLVKRSTWGFLLDIGQLTGQMTVILNTIWLVLNISNFGG
ncbi:MAG: putative polysaccharide export protein [Candidatus Scalindua rubra]|uniref:Putative polysaccharide export protein n=1 Tax=Candidatus Scalindua rubra TaxID=1872076 RepID=A0A1E3X3G3_9BACT|nr:MAG: putative polysaccharide export protein [Candidatus Scalindua rubra]